MTAPMTATPYAPAARQTATRSGVTPPSAYTGGRDDGVSAARPEGPSAGPYPGFEALGKNGDRVT